MKAKKIRPNSDEVRRIRAYCKTRHASAGVGGRMVLRVNDRISLVDQKIGTNIALLEGRTDHYDWNPWSALTSKGIEAAEGGKAEIDVSIYGNYGKGDHELADNVRLIFDDYRLVKIG